MFFLRLIQTSFTDLSTRVEALEASLTELSTANADLTERLAVRDAKDKAFLGKLKKLSIDMPESGEEKTPEPKAVLTNGIGG